MAQDSNVWDRLAPRYDRLWVQKYSLVPTRSAVKAIFALCLHKPVTTLLDLGCGTGQLLCELESEHPGANLYGADKSAEMIRLAREKTSGSTLFVLDIDTDELPEIIRENALDAIVCCHSFPYYQNKPAVLEKLHKALRTDGVLIFAQASINSFYDRLVLALVEKTAETAQYLSRRDFRDLISHRFVITSEFSVRERFYMPSICGFAAKKRL